MPEFDTILSIAEIESAEIIIAYNLRQIARARDKTALKEYYKSLSGLMARVERVTKGMVREERTEKAKDGYFN